VPLKAPELRVADEVLDRYVAEPGAAGSKLLAYPAHSNFSGVPCSPSALPVRLNRPWFSGGTAVTAGLQGHLVVPHSGHALFEDGTASYLGIPALETGLRHLERLGIDTIALRVEALGT
jgi:selenocysteine lyase/cysteine desulfurase